MNFTKIYELAVTHYNAVIVTENRLRFVIGGHIAC